MCGARCKEYVTDFLERLGKYATQEEKRNLCNFQHKGISVDKLQMQQREIAMRKGNSVSRWDHGTRNPPEALGFLYSMSILRRERIFSVRLGCISISWRKWSYTCGLYDRTNFLITLAST